MSQVTAAVVVGSTHSEEEIDTLNCLGINDKQRRTNKKI
jgi:hypothetical protein